MAGGQRITQLAGMAFQARKAASTLTGRCSSSLPRLHQLQTSTLPRLLGGGVLFSEQRGLEACQALADALQSLADTADALKQLAQALDSHSQNDGLKTVSHQNRTSNAKANWPVA